jgi:hypothetical protein
MSAVNLLTEFLAATDRNPLNHHERVYGCTAIALQRVSDSKVQINMIRALLKREGHGTVALRWLCDLADKHGVTLVGWICPRGRQPRMSKPQLRRWYTAHGFVVRKDWWMEREPLTAACQHQTCVLSGSQPHDEQTPAAPSSFPPPRHSQPAARPR